MVNQVILVDENDKAVGQMEKYETHQKGLLHRAFSVFIVNLRNELLLQRRAYSKYHSGGLWTNTCCSHPRPGEETQAAAMRRLKEEMGCECVLKRQFGFIYKADLDNGMTEYEYDHVYTGIHTLNPIPDPNEVAEWKWVSLEEISKSLKNHPNQYTVWFAHIWEKVAETLKVSNLQD